MQYGSLEGGQALGITAAVCKLPVNRRVKACNDAPRVVPLQRWDVNGMTSGARFGSFVEGADLFDAAAFSISR